MVPCPPAIARKIDAFIDNCGPLVDTTPALVVMAMHELARNLYAADPYIPFDPSVHRLDAIDTLLDKLIEFVSAGRALGSYGPPELGDGDSAELLEKTGRVYGKLWAQYPGDMVAEAVQIIQERFDKNEIPLHNIEGKIVLDAGCGSGRYSSALAKLGASKVVAVDFGEDGLGLARKLAKESGVDDRIEIRKGDLRALPLDENTFDFVFSNGTAHLSGDLPACSREIHRVLKPGGRSWFYVYGAGGVFWYARKRMTEFMKAIPQDYALEVLRLIGMPMNRFVFADNWYVPDELHNSAEDFESLLRDTGFSEIRRCHHGRATDFDDLSVRGSEKDRQMWGDGELRYLVEK